MKPTVRRGGHRIAPLCVAAAIFLSGCVRYTENYDPRGVPWYQRPLFLVQGEKIPNTSTLAKREGAALQAGPACFGTFALVMLANITSAFSGALTILTLGLVPQGGPAILLTAAAVQVSKNCQPIH